METQVSSPETAPRNSLDKNNLEWQTKLLPLMKRMIIFLALFFFIASFSQLIYLQVSINTAPAVNISQPLSQLQLTDKITLDERQRMAKLEALILLETNTMERRHHQANVLLMSSMWVRYLGFVTGMILAMIGAIFILGKLEQNEASEIGGKTAQGEITLKSSSPGIILVALGATLMILTIVMQHTIQVNDAAVYLQSEGNASILTDSQGKPIIIIPKDSTSQSHPPTVLPKDSTSKAMQQKTILQESTGQQQSEITMPKEKPSLAKPEIIIPK
ncbi:MAG: hypothetical protein ABI091_19975 [Ferruginibacter sp.]